MMLGIIVVDESDSELDGEDMSSGYSQIYADLEVNYSLTLSIPPALSLLDPAKDHQGLFVIPKSSTMFFQLVPLAAAERKSAASHHSSTMSLITTHSHAKKDFCPRLSNNSSPNRMNCTVVLCGQWKQTSVDSR
jgi:hypothetical protein